MNRDLCGLAPLFTDNIKIGDFMRVVYRTRKGAIKWEGLCTVLKNRGTDLLLEGVNKTKSFEEDTPYTFSISAKHVYHGKHHLVHLGNRDFVLP